MAKAKSAVPEKVKAHPSEQVAIFEGKRVEVEVATFALPNGYAYARIATKAVGGESGAGSLAEGATHDEIMQAIRHMQSEESARECGFAVYPSFEDAEPEWDDVEAGNPWERDGRVRRVSASNLAGVCEQIAGSLNLIKDRGGLVDWSAAVDGKPVDLTSWAKSAQRLDHLLDLGSFECESGALWASDPCYDSADAPGDVLTGAAGQWRAYSTRRGSGSWGDRTAQILIVREGDDPLAWLAEAGSAPWVDSGIDCGVDSGQAGFFDLHANGVPGGENDPFYEACCEATLCFMGGGAIKGGAAARSGDGDGGYPAQIARDASGTLVAARILFYEPTPEEVHAWGAAHAAREAQTLEKVARPCGKGPGGKSI